MASERGNDFKNTIIMKVLADSGNPGAAGSSYQKPLVGTHPIEKHLGLFRPEGGLVYESTCLPAPDSTGHHLLLLSLGNRHPLSQGVLVSCQRP